MDYKQISPDIVIRTTDDIVIPVDDPDFLAWLDAGNSPFPPDPPISEALTDLIARMQQQEDTQ